MLPSTFQRLTLATFTLACAGIVHGADAPADLIIFNGKVLTLNSASARASAVAVKDGKIARVRLVPEDTHVANYAFDVTPARLVSGLITERGVIVPTRDAIARAFPERVSAS